LAEDVRGTELLSLATVIKPSRMGFVCSANMHMPLHAARCSCVHKISPQQTYPEDQNSAHIEGFPVKGWS
jgi:hypothetical protein